MLTSNPTIPSRLLQVFLLLATLALAIYGLVVAKELLIPLLIAIVIWYLILAIASALQKLTIGSWQLPHWIAFLGSITLIGALVAFIFDQITSNIFAIIELLPIYQAKLTSIFNNTLTLLHITEPPNIGEIFKSFDALTIASNVAQTVTLIASNAGIITIYVLFLLLEYSSFDAKLQALLPDPKKHDKAQHLIRTISEQIQAYVRIKTALSTITAFLSYIVLKSVGVDFAEFWALLIFFLNYIPTIGSIIATLFPCLLTIVQFTNWTPFIIVTITLTTIQFTMGNIIEPRVIGKSVNLSGLVIILSLAFWGAIWGIVGMFLCVPIMVIVNIILANFTQTRPVAIILSGTGEIADSDSIN